MSDELNDDDARKWHHRFAAECNNRAWRISEAQTRSAMDNAEMLHAAHAAAFHWSRVGTEIHAARADMLLGHIHALLGHADLAMHYARASFTNVSARESPDWEVALAHAILANAASAAKNTELHSQHYALAKKIGEALSDTEEREIFEATFCRIPAPPARE